MDDQTDLHRLANALIANARDLEADLEWLAQQLQTRLSGYFAQPPQTPRLPAPDHPPPMLESSRSPYADLLRRHRLDASERLLLLLALAPHLRPQLLDVLWTRNDAIQRGFTEFGGGQGQAASAFLPSGETACFLLAGEHLATRLEVASLFAPDHPLARLDLLQLMPAPPGEPAMAGLLRPSARLLGLVTRGREAPPDFDPCFPARRITTSMDWSDLVLPAETMIQLEEIRDWLRHGRTLLDEWGMRGRLRPGHTSLFHGPPGTGKTLSACLLGKLCQCEVFRIDLSMVVSKYIGETEKNLARVFDQAEQAGWILFFDEADSLFGKRTRVDDAHDRYANQEVSYLLQRIEEFDGVTILASNLKTNIDDAFLRRFQSVISFAMPRPEERLRIWREGFPSQTSLAPDLDLEALAGRHELSGGTIMNVVRHASLRALSRGGREILGSDVEEGISRELHKEGRAF